MRYLCWNERCTEYAKRGATLSSSHTFVMSGERRCVECGKPVTRQHWVESWPAGVLITTLVSLLTLAAYFLTR